MENTLKKIDLGLYPTPLQEVSGMSELLGGGKRLFLKREDLCGIGLGGNKIRKLEYLLAEALAQSCDCVVTGAALSQIRPLPPLPVQTGLGWKHI